MHFLKYSPIVRRASSVIESRNKYRCLVNLLTGITEVEADVQELVELMRKLKTASDQKAQQTSDGCQPSLPYRAGYCVS